MNLVIVPIEPMEERYSAQWCRWFKRQLTEMGVAFQFVLPADTPSNTVITQGEFLDVIGTNIFKAKQLQQLCEMAQQGELTSDTVLLFHDLWFPGLEMLAYIRNALGLKFKITGMLHAGTWDQYDFISQKGMGSWGKHSELGWLQLADKIFVATNFHKNLITGYFKDDKLPNKIKVTGFPIFLDKEDLGESFYYLGEFGHKIKNQIVFPHRLAMEKQPEMFDLFKLTYNNKLYTFIRTKDTCKTKREYYKTLINSTYAVSFAKQETWGIAMQEAVMCGCAPIVPMDLSYAEMYPDRFKMQQTAGIVSARAKLYEFSKMPKEEFEAYVTDLARSFSIRGAAAIPNIMAELYALS